MLTISIRDQLIAGIRSIAMTPEPWAHAYLPALLPPAVALVLSRSFPQFDLRLCEEVIAVKSYRFAVADLDLSGDGRLPNAEWGAIRDVLCSADYRAAVSEVTGLRLDDSRLTLSVWEYRTGDWLAPHVDKAEKLATQIFYLTEGWQEGCCGRLLVLQSDDVESVVRALPPVLGSSALLVRSESSWHAVEAPAPAAPHRRSLTATFWRDGAPSGT